METLVQKNDLHKHLYNDLAQEYKKRAMNVLIQREIGEKAQKLKTYCDKCSVGNLAVEIGLGGGMMNKSLHDVGFDTLGIDIAENMVENAKSLNPEGSFVVGNYLETLLPKQYDLMVGLAFIHLFDQEESMLILQKMYQDLVSGGVLHLTTTKESSYAHQKCPKQDYGSSYVRYRTKHTPESFVDLVSRSDFSVDSLGFEKGQDGKERMSLIARKF